MSKATFLFRRLPIKWKLTLLSTLLLFLLFAAYNAVQYFVIEKWMIRQEKSGIEQNMREILNYFLEQEFSFDEAESSHIRGFLEKINEKNQSIRVLDDKGRPIVAVSNMPEDSPHSPPPFVPEKIGTFFSKDRLLVMRSPFTIFEFNGTVEIMKSTDYFVKLITAISRIMLVFGLGAIVISGLAGILLARQLLKPLQSMADAIRKIKRQGLHERVQTTDNEDEIATLMKLFNKMMDQVERSFRQQRQFVEDASHELRTPITIIEGHLSLLQRWGKNDPAILEESLDISIQELSRLKGLVQELLALTRAEDGEPADNVRLANPHELIGNVSKRIAVLHPAFQFDTDLAPLTDIEIAVSGQHLEQMLLIVLDNAVKYSTSGRKRISISGTVQSGQACIAITDSGIGIPEKDLPYVLDRFYRVDKARCREQGGHGLGLAIAKQLTEKYGGTISIQSEEHEGTTVSICLPTVSTIS